MTMRPNKHSVFSFWIIQLLILGAMGGCQKENPDQQKGPGDINDAGANPLSDLGFHVDGDPVLSTDGAMHHLSTLAVEGKVTTNFSSPATGVDIIARCGDKEVKAVSKDDGSYHLIADVKECAPLVLEFNKESYLPNFRVIHLPPPTSPVTLDVPLADLNKLQCGSFRCTPETDNRWKIPNKVVKQGWSISMTGTSALDYIGGEFRTTQGSLIMFVGFSYFDFRGQAGNQLITFDAKDQFNLAVPVDDPTARDWFGDMDPNTEEVELYWYSFDAQKGSWYPNSLWGKVLYTKGNEVEIGSNGECIEKKDAEGNPILEIVPATRSQLADIRANTLYIDDPCNKDMNGKPQKKWVTEFWVGGPIVGSGWYGWGITTPPKTCFSLQAKDQCGNPVSNIVFNLKGRDHGFRADAWTDNAGKACLEVVPSEPTGQDYDGDGLGGETFWVDVNLAWKAGSYETIYAHKTPVNQPQSPQSCANVNSCKLLEQTVNNLNADCSKSSSSL